MSNFRTSLLATATAFALLSAPLAFAQSTDATAQQQTDTSATADTAGTAADANAQTDTNATTGTDATAQSGTMQSDTGATTGTDTASQATASTQAGAMSWSDIDTDKDGNISKTEAAAMPALDRVFADADGDADGSLTADEYRAYAERASAEGTTGAEAGAATGADVDSGVDAGVDADVNADVNADAGKDDEKK